MSAIGHKELANAIRALAMDAVEQAKSGHPGMPMGMADVATVLFTKHLKYSAQHPTGRTAIASSCRPVTARCCSMRSCT
jgi:transketolase